tara:strand:- start:8349 stop:8987 length:639 start_codon:yes stop_codon:yes gene_type:complete
MKFNIFFILLLNLKVLVNGFNLCVVGANSGLGRELIYQKLEQNEKVLALTNSSRQLRIPYRGGGMNNRKNNLFISSENLKIDCYENFNNYNFENIVFTLGAKPFETDYSDLITENILNNIEHNIKSITLVSADGVGDSLNDNNLGIKVMNNWYLKDVYRAKNRQEEIVEEYAKKNNIKTFIMRPKALSYGINMYAARSRETYAREILDNLNA